MTTAFSYQIVLDDLDYLNHVGHAHWFFILEKSRTHFLEQLGLPLPTLLSRQIACVVAGAQIKYRRPAKFGDRIEIVNLPMDPTEVGLTLVSSVVDNDKKEIVQAQFNMVFVNGNGRPTSIPSDLREKIFRAPHGREELMQFLFTNERSAVQQRIFEAGAKSNWRTSDLFAPDSTSPYKDEKSRLLWAPIIAPMALAETTALYGFGGRIAEASNLSLKSWLIQQLSDEAKHTEGFAAILRYLYPSYRDRLESLLPSKRELLLFYGVVEKCKSLMEWMICTQIIEVFGKYSYTALYRSIKQEPNVEKFLSQVIKDENRHIAYLASVVSDERNKISPAAWNLAYGKLIEKATLRARLIFESLRHNGIRAAYERNDIDVKKICDDAVTEIHRHLG